MLGRIVQLGIALVAVLAETLDWQQRFCRHLCERSARCSFSGKGSYCKTDQNPPICFGMYRFPKQSATLVEQARNPLLFCTGDPLTDEERCKDARVKPVGCSRRPVWNRYGRVLNLDQFLDGEH